MWKIVGGFFSTLATVIAIWTFWDDIAPKIVQFRPTSSLYQPVPGEKDTYTCVSPCGAALLEWHVKGRRAQAFLDDKPVDTDSGQVLDGNSSRQFKLRVKGLVHDDLRTVTIIIKTTPTSNPAPDPNPGTNPDPGPNPNPGQTPNISATSPTDHGGQPPPSRLHSIAILSPKVGPIYTKNQVSAQVTSQIAGYFRAHNYDVSSTPAGIGSLDQYVNMARNSSGPVTDWAVQAEVEMKPTFQHKNTGRVSANQLLPNGGGMPVDLTMNCSVTITILHLPHGDHHGTSVGQGKVVRTVAMNMMTPAVQDPEFSRAAAEKATTDALLNLRIEK